MAFILFFKLVLRRQSEGHTHTPEQNPTHQNRIEGFSNSAVGLTRTARSACDAPPIMLGTKLLCPGASRMVKCFFSVSK